MALTVLIKPASGKCNLRCRYCFYADEAENRAVGDYGFMSAETAENVVRRAFETGEREYIFAFQGGEPMLAGLAFYEAFVRRVGEYNKKRAKVHYTIQTNGTLIDGAFAKFFKRSGFLVGVSLDGDAAVHDADRLTADGRGSFARVEEGIRRLEEAGADFNIVSVVNKKNYKKIGQTYRFFREKGFRWLQFIPCVDTVRSGSPFMLRSGQMARYLCELFDLWFEDLLHGGRVVGGGAGCLYGRKPCAVGRARGRVITEQRAYRKGARILHAPELCGEGTEKAIRPQEITIFAQKSLTNEAKKVKLKNSQVARHALSPQCLRLCRDV